MIKEIIESILLVLKKAFDPIAYKGEIGEVSVARKLGQLNEYKKIINNIYINDQGKSRQIDHIAITQHGVFVIETKNYAGAIYGKESSTQWKQYLNKKCFEFKNPIHQNYAHFKIVESLISDITKNIEPLVVFTRRCNLKVITQSKVMYEEELIKYIKSKENVLTEEKIDCIYEKLIQEQITNTEQIRDHNYNVQRYTEYKSKVAERGVCPRCGGEMIKRTGKNGEFYGCRNYPKCHYTKQI